MGLKRFFIPGRSWKHKVNRVSIHTSISLFEVADGPANRELAETYAHTALITAMRRARWGFSLKAHTSLFM
jgi:hypothetical protein